MLHVKINYKICFAVCVVVAIHFSGLIFVGSILGQESTPTGYVSIQGRSNLGTVEPLSLEQILTRTGLASWFNAGWTGKDIRIGVLDVYFGGLSAFEGEFGTDVQIPAGINQQDYDRDLWAHGSDVLSTIHMIAPEAQLFACRYRNFDDYVSCIDWMIASGVQIINHSAGVPALPLDGTNEWARQVDRVTRAGVLWVNAAGNFANGYISDFFTDNDLNTYHEFRGNGISESLEVSSVGDTSGRVMLSWDSSPSYAANAINLDLEIVDEYGQSLTNSANEQQGNPSDRPLEVALVDMSHPFKIQIRNVDGRANQIRLVLFVEFASLTGAEQGGIIAPGDSINSLTVGALQGNIIAPYSSRGPLITGAVKPDIAAPGELVLSNGDRFVGTSAAAPVVAGFAALIWQANPEWTRDQVLGYLLNSAQDDGELPGKDNNYGVGRLVVIPPDVDNSSAETESSSIACPDGAPTRLYSGVFGIVENADNATLNVRTEPALSGDRIEQLQPRQTFRVIDGPTCTDAIAWFNIDFGGNTTGWIAEGILENGNPQYFVLPLNLNVLVTDPCRDEFFFGSGSGCPQGPTEEIYTAFQWYERGFMMWRSVPDEFYVFFNDGTFSLYHVSSVRAMPDNPIGDAPPSGRISPISGFGRIWGSDESVRNRLGWAIEPEQGYQMRLQNIAITSTDASDKLLFYVALPDGRIVGIGVNTESRFWRYIQ